ncbi:MAG: V-type ATP synthase subunit A, partial [Anaerovoracaceae bacterium]
MKEGKIVKVSGPLVVASGMEEADMYDVVRVGDLGLIGEIIEMRDDMASIQVYEDTAGIGPGTPVVSTGAPLSVELGPGLIETMYDGIQRPLEEMRNVAGSNITRGIRVPSISRNKLWDFVPTVNQGDKVIEGEIIGTVQETLVVQQKIMVP